MTDRPSTARPTLRKVQTQLLVDPPIRDRSDILAAARSNPRAEVYRLAIEIGLWELEQKHLAAVQQVHHLAERFGMTAVALAERMLQDGVSLRDIETCSAYPIE